MLQAIDIILPFWELYWVIFWKCQSFLWDETLIWWTLRKYCMFRYHLNLLSVDLKLFGEWRALPCFKPCAALLHWRNIPSSTTCLTKTHTQRNKTQFVHLAGGGEGERVSGKVQRVIIPTVHTIIMISPIV